MNRTDSFTASTARSAHLEQQIALHPGDFGC